MKTVRNKTSRPIKIPVGGGKTLHLGPAKSGQVSDQALELGAFKKLVESGAVEVLGGGAAARGTADSGPAPVQESTHGHAQPKVVLPKGNR